MTHFEPKQPKYGNSDIGNRYLIWDEDINNFVGGVLTEVGDETVVFQWDDLDVESEYQLFDLPIIIPEGSNTITNNPYYYDIKRILESAQNSEEAIGGVLKQYEVTPRNKK